MYQFDWSIIPPIIPVLLKGLGLTLQIAITSIVISMILAVPLALARMAPLPALRWPAQMYIEIFRGTPMLIQLVWVYYALPAVLGLQIPAFIAVVMALAANLTAFMSEAYRAALQSVPKEHVEAGQVIGLSRWDILRYITIPQAFRQQIPVILSLDISLFKDTALVSALGVSDLTFTANIQSSQTFRPMEIYTFVAAMYFMVAFPLTLLTSYLERRMIAKQSGTDSGSSANSGLRATLAKVAPGSLLLGRW
jgi:polar amino acid transport system permease protein